MLALFIAADLRLIGSRGFQGLLRDNEGLQRGLPRAGAQACQAGLVARIAGI